MRLQESDEIVEQGIGNTSISLEVGQLCEIAKRFEDAGEYEAARTALSSWWQRVGDRPNLDGLDEVTQADLLLRAGTLSGWIGRSTQIKGAQEIAKDLIYESVRIFERLGLTQKWAGAQIDLATCYWREGAIDEARITLRDVLGKLGDAKNDERLRALANLIIIENSARRYKDALRIHAEVAPLFEESSNHGFRGNFHNEIAVALKNLGKAEGRADYIDRAFIEFSAASYHWEQAGHMRFVALVENNIGFLFLTTGRPIEAHRHLNRARSIFVKHKDKSSIAQVDETRARVFLAEGRNTQAEMAVRNSVQILKDGDEQSIFAEALTTHGTALARLNRHERAQAQFQKAIDVAEQAGDLEGAGVAALTMLEELPGYLQAKALRQSYRSAESLLARSQDPSIDARLGQCARVILAAELSRRGDPDNLGAAKANGNAQFVEEGQPEALTQPWEGCSLEDEVSRYEGQLIKRALEASGGSITRAARMLHCTHQGLAFILNGRHKSLLTVRTPIRSRRRSIIRKNREH